MTRYVSFLILVLLTAAATCGYSQSKLVFTGLYKGNYHPFDSLLIEDLNTGNKMVKYYPDTILKLLITGIDELPGKSECSLSQNYPNPFWEKTKFNIYLPKDDKLDIRILNVSGMVILRYERFLSSGEHSFTFTGGKEQIFLLTVKSGSFSSSVKMIKASNTGNGVANIEYNGRVSDQNSSKKGMSEFEYNAGDYLTFTGYMTDGAGVVVPDTITDIPSESTTYTFRFEKIPRVLILLYHKITDSVPGDDYQRNIADFEKDLVYFQDHNYTILSMEDLPQLKSGERKLDSDAIIITFDDGYESNYSKVFPLLKNYNMPATFFLVTEWIETADFMNWSEVWLMSQYLNPAGKSIFRMGSHTSSHPYLERSAQYFNVRQDYLNFLNTELRDSRTWIADVTGQTKLFLSLPYGDGANNQDIIITAKANGYEGIRTSVWNSFAIQQMNLFALPALPVLSGSSIEMINNYFNY